MAECFHGIAKVVEPLVPHGAGPKAGYRGRTPVTSADMPRKVAIETDLPADLVDFEHRCSLASKVMVIAGQETARIGPS